MPPLTTPCLLFALAREALCFWRHVRRVRRLRGCPTPCWLVEHRGRPLLIVQTGLGSQAMSAALDWLLANPILDGCSYRPDCVVLAGFSGALQPHLRVGDLVLADEIVDHHQRVWRPTPLAHSPLQTGRILTVPELIGCPEEKRRLGEQYQALAVDMESATAARLCHEVGVPFTCLRAISDDGGTPLSPRLVGVLRRGTVSPARLLAAVLRQPGMIAELWRLARDTKRAARQLAAALVDQVLVEGVSAGCCMQRIT